MCNYKEPVLNNPGQYDSVLFYGSNGQMLLEFMYQQVRHGQGWKVHGGTESGDWS